MNLLQTIRTIEEVAKGIPNVHTVVSAFEDLNREDTVYSAVIIQQQSHTHNDDWMQYNFYIGMADRLVEDGSNELSVQSTAMNTIHSIVRALRNILPSAEISYSNTNVFTQRFTALCAGAYETVSIILPISECDDSNEGIPGLDALSTTITENGDYNFVPDGLGFDNVHIVVDVQPDVSLEERSISINENGQVVVITTPGFTGMSKVNINVAVPQEGGYKEGYDEGYSKGHQEGVNEGYADGVEAQKSKLQDITITENGTYDREDGYKHIVVDVPASAEAEGYTININENGTFTYTPQEGVVWNSVTVIANVPTEGGYQEGYEAGYTAGHEAGYTEGYNAGKADGKVEGIAEQKAKLSNIEITANGTYEKEDGYNRVVVNVERKIRLQEKTIDPATTTVVVTPLVWFDGLSKVTVNPVDSNIDPNIVPENIKTGVTILGVEGTAAAPTGTIQITENGEVDVTPYATAIVNITTPATTYKVPDGLKFSDTTLSELPADLDFSDVHNLNNMFRSSSITKLPNTIDWKNITSLSDTFNSSLIKELPQDFAVDNCSYIYAPFGNTAIKNLPTLAPKVTNNILAILNDSNIESIDSMDLSYTTFYEAISEEYFSPLKSCPMIGSLGGQLGQINDLLFKFNRGHNNVSDDDFKSIFEAALRTGNKPEGRTWKMQFDTICVDSTGELSNYVQSLTQKGWTITGLEFVNTDPFTVRLASGADSISLSDTSFSDQLVITCPEDKSWRIPWNQEYDFPTIDGGTIRHSIFDFIQGIGDQEGHGNQSIDITSANFNLNYIKNLGLDNFDIMFYVSGPSTAKPVRVVYNRLGDDVWVKFGDNQAMEFYYDNHSVLRFVDDNGNELRVNNANIQNYINDDRLVVEGNIKYVFKGIRKSDFPGWKLVSMGANSAIDDNDKDSIYTQGNSISNTAFNKYVIHNIEYLDARYFKTMIGWNSVYYMDTVRTSSNLLRVSFSTDTALKSIPSLTTPNVEEFRFSISGSSNITSIPAYDGHSIKKSFRMISGLGYGSKATSVNRVGGFDGIGANYDTQNTEYHELNYDYIPNIEISDIITQFNMLATLGAGITASIYLTTKQNAQISDEKKAIATNKGWTINVRNS